MDFSQVKDFGDFVLIPEGTVVEAKITKVSVGYGKSDKTKTVMTMECAVETPEYIGAVITDHITLAGGDPGILELNKSKIKRMLEYGKGANPSNLAAYIIPEVTNPQGKSIPKWSELNGIKIGFQIKLDSFISNKTGKKLFSNKVGAYASKNPESGGYKFFDAIAKGIQPWQKPLPDMNSQQTSNSQLVGSNDFEQPPIEAYSDGRF